VAAGRGLRFDQRTQFAPKQLRLLGGKPLLARSVETFAAHPMVDEVILVVPGDLEELFKQFIGPKVRLTKGGDKRVDSTMAGLAAVSHQAEVIVVHDGVRPLVTSEQIESVVKAAFKEGAAILAVPVRDTLKKADPQGFISGTVDRQDLWQAQTPQGFSRKVLEQAMAQAKVVEATDEASLVESMGVKVKLVTGRPDNIKITEPVDLAIAERLLSSAQGLRVGQGWDFHRFDPLRPLFLGCVFIEGQPGLAGHSDADVLAHALVDAVLGASALGDIGTLFPPTEEAWKGAPGAKLLSLAYRAAQKKGFFLINADLTLIGEQPKIFQYRSAIIKALAKALGEPEKLFNIKGKTTEGLGFLGRGEGLAAQAMVLMRQM
jgi:2-C-methyl-D-erythritol 4-phosphate cytidylyltransferase/2-C-methyl-D-erythritol 2,4-cyclodiphosphate synthase